MDTKKFHNDCAGIFRIPVNVSEHRIERLERCGAIVA